MTPSSTSSTFLPLVTAVAAVIAGMGAVAAAVRTRGSTAVPAAWWAVAACSALAVDAWARWSGAVTQPATAGCVRLCVAALAVCPAMSLLGAKRPQHGVWQLIVATLAAVVALPAASAWLVRPGSMPDTHLLGRGFLLVLTIVGWLNFVATGHGLSATAIAAGQLAVVRPFLPGVDTAGALPQPLLDAAGAALIAAGATVAWLRGAMARRPPVSAPTVPATIDGPFLALRDTLGAAWALRIAERFDTVATERGWPCRLHFTGLDVGGDPTDATWHRDALRAFRALMRRFVDDAWLLRHGWPETHEPAMAPSPEGL